jgi:hypothetical protein
MVKVSGVFVCNVSVAHAAAAEPDADADAAMLGVMVGVPTPGAQAMSSTARADRAVRDTARGDVRISESSWGGEF